MKETARPEDNLTRHSESLERSSFVRWPEESSESPQSDVITETEHFIGPENRIDSSPPLLLNSFF